MKLNAMALLASSMATPGLATARNRHPASSNALDLPALDSASNITLRTADMFPHKGSGNFLVSLQCKATSGPTMGETADFFPKFSNHDAACSALMGSMEASLNLDQKRRVRLAVDSARLVHKNTISGLRHKLENFPVAKEELHDKDTLTYHPAVCSSVVSDAPLVTTFNWHEQLFYGMLLDPQKLVPVLTSHRNLWSDDCAYEVEKWTNRVPAQAGMQPEWNHRPISNAAPSGELCHDMDVAMHMTARDIALGEGGHDSLRNQEILTFNEVNVVKQDQASGQVAKGIFVDLVSNDFVYLLRKPKYQSLLRLSQLVPMDRWMKAIQIVNLDFLATRQEEFADAKALCNEQNLPFFLRSMDDQGVIAFRQVAIGEADSIRDLVQSNPALSSPAHGLLTPIVKMLKAVIT